MNETYLKGELQNLFKGYVFAYVLFCTFVCLIYTVLYQVLNFNFISIYCFINFLFSVAILVYIYKKKFHEIKPFINPYLVATTLHLLLFGILFLDKTPVVLFWYILIPYSILEIYSGRTLLYWCFYILFLISLSIVSSYFIKMENVNLSMDDFKIVNITLIFLVIAGFIIITYYNNKIKNLKKKIHLIIKDREEYVLSNIQKADIKRKIREATYENLYNKIIVYLEASNSYYNFDFSLVQLANALDTNVSYISQAIRFHTDTNFVSFINKYRIEKAKEMIRNNILEKHSLYYVYSSVGFKHQSTFNKAFKHQEGITPTEYIKMLNEDIRDNHN